MWGFITTFISHYLICMIHICIKCNYTTFISRCLHLLFSRDFIWKSTLCFPHFLCWEPTHLLLFLHPTHSESFKYHLNADASQQFHLQPPVYSASLQAHWTGIASLCCPNRTEGPSLFLISGNDDAHPAKNTGLTFDPHTRIHANRLLFCSGLFQQGLTTLQATSQLLCIAHKILLPPATLISFCISPSLEPPPAQVQPNWLPSCFSITPSSSCVRAFLSTCCSLCLHTPLQIPLLHSDCHTK